MGRVHSGSIIQASAFKKNDASPLDDRVVVENEVDLRTASVWTVSNVDTRYEGMMVYVEGVTTSSEKGVYVLTNGSAPNVASSWSKLGGDDTNTWRNIYTDNTSRVGTGIDTKAVNFKGGDNITLTYKAAGTGEGQSGNADYFNIEIAATDTNTWRNIYTGGTSRIGTGTGTKAINYQAGDNITIAYEAAGTGTGQSGSADYFNVKISATDTNTWRGIYVDNVSKAGTGTNTKGLNLKAGNNVTLTYGTGTNDYFNVEISATDTNTTYSSGNEITINSTNNHINHDAKLGSAFTSHTATTTISGFGGSGTIKVPVFNVNEYGHITSASEVDLSVTIPEAKIAAYSAPTYTQGHLSNAWVTAYTNNAIAVNTTYDSAFNRLDNKIKVLADELSNAEATLSQAVEDETRYYAKSTTATASSGSLQLSALLVENRTCTLLNGTKIDVYFQNDQTLTTGTLRVGGPNGYSAYKQLVYEDALFDTSLINAGTTLALVYDSGSVTISGTTYTGFFRVVGGVGSGGSCEPVTTQVINVNNPIGTYNVGDNIPIGTLLETIIRNMLMVVIDVAKTNPTLSWSWSPSSTYEVGTTVTPTASGGTKTQGNYQSADTTKYTVAEFITNNPSASAQGVLTAGSDISASISYPGAYKGTSETSHTFTASYPYTNDTTVVPKKSDNTASSNTITAGTASASKSCSYRYKYFVGGTAYLASGNYSSVFTTKASLSSLTSGWCGTGTTTVGTVTAQSGATTMILVLPSSVGSHTATVTKTLYLGQDVKSNWVFQNNITYTLPDNSTTVTYKVYAVHNGADGLQYTDVQFT